MKRTLWAVMSGIVRVSCPGCGEIEVRADEITVRACSELAQNIYRFRCDRCETFVIKDASPSTVQLLIRAGVRIDPWRPSTGQRELRNDPPIHIDELIDFHFELEALPTADPP